MAAENDALARVADRIEQSLADLKGIESAPQWADERAGAAALVQKIRTWTKGIDSTVEWVNHKLKGRTVSRGRPSNAILDEFAALAAAAFEQWTGHGPSSREFRAFLKEALEIMGERLLPNTIDNLVRKARDHAIKFDD
jgi:hypothetical protein